MTPTRPRHPNKDLEKLMKRAEAVGWVFAKGSKYYVGKCACGLHLQTVHLTPNQGYLRNLRMQFRRYECWKEQT